MHRNRTVRALISLVAGLVLANAVHATEEWPDITVDGLHKLKDTDLGLVYALPEADLSIYQRVKLLEPAVAFKKNWQRNQNRSSSFRVRTSDMEKIKANLADLFMEVVSEELTEGGYQLTEETGEDVLLVRPAIVNLDITAPDINTPNRSYRFSESAGEMTLYIELYDSETSALIAKALDRKRDREKGYMQWQTRVTNTQAARRILKSWAKTLREALDEARETATGD